MTGTITQCLDIGENRLRFHVPSFSVQAAVSCFLSSPAIVEIYADQGCAQLHCAFWYSVAHSTLLRSWHATPRFDFWLLPADGCHLRLCGAVRSDGRTRNGSD